MIQTEIDEESVYTLIETEEQLDKCMKSISTVPWIAIDTEFIPENRYRPLLCIIQISSPKGNYIIDCKKVRDLTLFYKIVQNRL